jgi:hypothetical protein
MRAAVLLLGLVLASCRATPPAGVFACDGDEDCPPGQTCVGDRCQVEGRDAPGIDAPGRDAPFDDAGPDTPELDAPTFPVPLRLLHAAPGRPAAAIEQAGAPLTSMVAFGGTTARATLPSGAREVRVTGTGLIATASAVLDPARTYTVVLFSEGTADRLAVLEDPPEDRHVLFHAMDTALIVEVPELTGVRLEPGSARPIMSLPARVPLRASGADVLAVLDGGVLPPAEPAVIVLAGRSTAHPLDTLGPQLVATSLGGRVLRSLPLTWLVASTRGAALCDGATPLLSAPAGGSAGPIWDVPAGVMLADGDCRTRTGPLITLPEGPRHLFALRVTPVTGSLEPYVVSEPPSPPGAGPRHVVLNGAASATVTITGLSGISMIGAGMTESTDIAGAATTIDVMFGGLGSRTYTVPLGPTVFHVITGTAGARGYLGAALMPGAPLVLERDAF